MSYQTCPKCNGSGKKWNFTPTGCVYFDLAVTLPTITKVGDELEINYPTKEVCPSSTNGLMC